jgi:hypothetical protein
VDRIEPVREQIKTSKKIPLRAVLPSQEVPLHKGFITQDQGLMDAAGAALKEFD